MSLAFSFIQGLLRSASPSPNDTVFAAFNEVSVLQSDALDVGCVAANASTTVPVVTIGLVVDLDDIFSSRSHNSSRVEHHASDRFVVSKGVINRSSPEIPYLIQLAKETYQA